MTNPETEQLMEQFQELMREAAPHRTATAEITAKQVALSHEIAKNLIKEAWPDIEVTEIQSVAEVKPTDMAKSAMETVKALQSCGITPKRMVCDSRRFLIHLSV